MRSRKLTYALLALLYTSVALAQTVPSPEEGIDFVSTFGRDADSKFGDDDKLQIFFFLIPKTFTKPFYVRIFDPEIGAKNDLLVGDRFNTTTRFEIFGGFQCYSNPAARSFSKQEGYDSGKLLNTVEFSELNKYDEKWFNLGPFNPREGEYIKEFDAYIFKFIATGISGDDGNTYRISLSLENDRNTAILGANIFTYNYTFRLKDKPFSVAHIYPFIDTKTKSIKQVNFDFDDEGEIKIYSRTKSGHKVATSADNESVHSTHTIDKEEQGKTMDLQIVKNQSRINDMSIYVLNQYNEAVPFFAIPIGGVPQYRFKVDIRYDYRNKKQSY